MGDVLKILERQRLEAEIDEAEQTLKLIECKYDNLMDKGARAPVERIRDIYGELLEAGVTPEQEEKLIREKNELRKNLLYIELCSYEEPSGKAYEKLFKAKYALEQLLAEEAPPIAPATAIAPLHSGNAERGTPNTNMGDVLKILERQRLEAEIDEAEQTLKSINYKCDNIMDMGARALIGRICDIYDELLEAGVSDEQEEELMRERNELQKNPLYIELRSYEDPRGEAYEKLDKAKDALEQLLAEEAPPIAPATAIAPLPSGNAESGTPHSFVSCAPQFWGRVTGFLRVHDVHDQKKEKTM